jgi:GDPmannose 4,6-dehydratase
MLMRHALIFGITGQDGSYLAELLLSKGYVVHGVTRRVSTSNHERIAHIKDDNLLLVEGDVTDPHSVNQVVHDAYISGTLTGHVPRLEIYNLAAQSHVRTSFDQPVYTWNATATGALNILEACKHLDRETVRYYQAGSSEMFGASLGILYTSPLITIGDGIVGNSRYMQSETTPFDPRSPYAVAKLAAHNLTKIYRDGYNLFACNGILFNHESERRGDMFVTRKITKHLAGLVQLAKQRAVGHSGPPRNYGDYLQEDFPKLKLGNLSAYRDWGHAEDFVKAMWLMLQQDKPDDYVIATGEAHSVREFLVEAFNYALGYYSDRFVETDQNLFRATEVNYLCGDYRKAKEKLGWTPQIKFKELVTRMVDGDLHGVNNG